MKRAIILLFFSLLCGCASLDDQRRLNPRTGTWNQIQQSGMSEDADYNFLTGVVSPRGDIFFKPDSIRATWWGLFKSFAFFNSAVFNSKWYDPAGNLFWEEEFSSGYWNVEFAKVSLPLAGSPARNLPGIWRVEIYYKGDLIDQKRFQIAHPASAGALAAGTHHPGGEPLASFWQAPSPAQPAADFDHFFDDHYRQAEMYFERKMYEESRAHLKRILEKEPYRTEAHLALGTIYFRELKWDESLKELDYVLQNPAYRNHALNIRSMVLEMKERSKTAAYETHVA